MEVATRLSAIIKDDREIFSIKLNLIIPFIGKPAITDDSYRRGQFVKILRAFVNANMAASRAVDRILPSALSEDGNRAFINRYLSVALNHGDVVYDVGGGSQPFVSIELKEQLGLKIVGLDISADELAAAPEGVYDGMLVADLCTVVGNQDADIVVCQALLEHVRDGTGALRAIASVMKPGGRAYIFAPSRNALFARLNMALPEGTKKAILFSLFPNKAKGHDGFPAYYNQCTPRDIERLAAENGLEVDKRELFWTSSYFYSFFPAYLAWRLSQFMAYLFIGYNAAETFIYVLSKKKGVEGR